MKLKNASTVTLATLLIATTLAQAAIIPSGLVGHWTGDGNANDSSTSDLDGTFTGSYSAGVFGSSFNLLNGPVIIPDSPALTFSNNVSISFWFNQNGQGGGSFIGQDDGAGWERKWFIDYGYNGPFFEMVLSAPPVAFIQSSAFALPTGWNHAALVKNGGLYTFYLNGNAVGSQISNDPFPNPLSPLKFGYAEADVAPFRGLMDEVSIYGRALSPSEVVFVATIPEPATGTLALLGLAYLGWQRNRSRRNA